MRYEVTTGLTPREALEQAAAYFGPDGMGLHAVTQTPHSLVFQGGGGHVALTVHPGTPTTLELETREWDGEPAAPLVGPLVAPETPGGPALAGVPYP